MQEIRPNIQNNQINAPQQRAPGGGWGKKMFLFLGIVVVLAGLIILVWKLQPIINEREAEGVNSGNYTAVFLSNSQVYFGKVIKNDDIEIALKDVYYLQLAEGSTDASSGIGAGQSRFNLIKLGSEIHGPTDEMYISKAQVLFYEELRGDSKVVESINQSKGEGQ